MPIPHSILAVIARGPATPAGIRERLTEEATPIGDLNMGQVTQTLTRLQRDGFIEDAGQQRAANGRATTLWRITPSGKDELTEWWSRPVGRPHRDRDELVLKVCLALHDADVEVLPILDHQRTHVLRELRTLTTDARAARADTAHDELSPALLTYEKSIYEREAAIRWLDRVEDVLARRRRFSSPSPKESQS